MECQACGRDWRVQFLCCDRFESRRPAPVDIWPIPPGEAAETVLRRVLKRREQESLPKEQPKEYRRSTPEDAARARQWLARLRTQAGGR